MIFLQRSGVCDPIMHFIDNQTLHNPVLGPNNQFLCIGTIPDSVMWPQSSVLLWRILTALYCTNNYDLQVSRNNFVSHWQNETERMIVSKEGTVRGIRHRVNKIKMDMMESGNTDQDKCLLHKQVMVIL